MDARALAEQLSDAEATTLRALSTRGNIADPRESARELGLAEDALRRAFSMLASKGLARLDTDTRESFALSERGKKTLESGLPEERVLDALARGPLSIDEIAAAGNLAKTEVGAALGIAKKLSFVALDNGRVRRTPVADAFEAMRAAKKAFLKKLGEGEAQADRDEEKNWLAEFVDRGLAEKKKSSRQSLSITPLGRETLRELAHVTARSFDVRPPAPRLPRGNAQAYYRFLRLVRRRLTELGFLEMESRIVTSEFYNFDVLFQPQNHPARSWTDTYQLKHPARGKLPDKRIVDAVKNAHENGGKTASAGWKYAWDPGVAARLMPAAHGTAHSAATLATGVKAPAKYFTIARCFRPDVIDARHLQEFNQLDGFIIGKGLAFTHLLGMLLQFAREIAHADEVEFVPSYYPFVEPAVQLNAKHPLMGMIELGGAGIFRPEMTVNLGYTEPVIAWGLGVDRLAMFALGIKDIRDLFSTDIDWLQAQPWKDL